MSPPKDIGHPTCHAWDAGDRKGRPYAGSLPGILSVTAPEDRRAPKGANHA